MGTLKVNFPCPDTIMLVSRHLRSNQHFMTTPASKSFNFKKKRALQAQTLHPVFVEGMLMEIL